MRGYESNIRAFQFPEEPFESDSLHWDEWAINSASGVYTAEAMIGNSGDQLHKSGFESQANTLSNATCRPDECVSGLQVEGCERESIRQALEEGRSLGRSEGLAQGRAEGTAIGQSEERIRQTTERDEERRLRSASAAELINEFYRAQERYLHNVEPEVVELALALAARVLRRESQMDPLMLTGAVRVALGQLSESTRVVLHVPASELDLWTDAMRLMPNLKMRPTVVIGDGMSLGDCRVETEMGSADLGVRAQLAEIERGFFDSTRKRADVSRTDERGESVVKPSRGESTRQTEITALNTNPHPSEMNASASLSLDATEYKTVDAQYLDEPVSLSIEHDGFSDYAGNESQVEGQSVQNQAVMTGEALS